MIDRGTCKAMLRESARLMLEQADRLSDIDSKFGDGDHGITITKIAKLMDERAEAWDEESIKDFLDDLGMAAMAVRGGSAGPLYGTMIGGLGARLGDDENELSADAARRMFAGCLAEVQDITNAQVGDKTMMDALIPAVEAAQTCPAADDDAAAVFAAAAEAAGWPVPEGDIVAPNMTNPTPFGDAARALARRITAGSTANEAPNAAAAEAAIEDIEHALPVETEPADAEPIPLDGEGASTLDRRMGEWIIAACKDKRLAFALAFPFVRRPLSLDAVRATSVQNAGVGVVVFIPGADMPIMTLNQAKMLLQIAAAYGQPLSAERIKELAAVVGGAFLFRNIARTAVGVVPVLGWAIKGAIGFAGTEAMGHAAIEYFEAGGDIVGVASVVQKARDEAVEAASKAAATPAGGKVIEAARGAGASAFRALRGKGKGAGKGGARG